jgi:ribosomal protein S27E
MLWFNDLNCMDCESITRAYVKSYIECILCGIELYKQLWGAHTVISPFEESNKCG